VRAILNFLTGSLGRVFPANIACLLAAGFLAAPRAAGDGAIKGVVLEQASGRPLARSIVRLQPVPKPGNQAKPLQTRAESTGAFVFPIVPDGLYLIIATREYYFPAAYGQRRPDGQGTPVEVNADLNIFAELRMRRMGVVTGRVLDENDIGMPDVPVVAYRARFPLHSVGRGTSDDRGVYRIFDLQPGKYWVRTVAHTLDDGSGRLPTFGPESMETVNARLHEVRVDEEATYADLRPVPGRLFHFGGRLNCPPPAMATVTLSSETERRATQAPCGGSYRFEGLAPAQYEVLAETRDGLAGFTEMFVDRDDDRGGVDLAPRPNVDVEVRRADTHGRANIRITLMGHRQDLSDLGKDQPIETPDMTTNVALAPGHWLMSAIVGPTQYVESITGSNIARERRVTQPPDAFDVVIYGGSTRIVVTVSDHAGQLEGTVSNSDSKPVPGAPVFLWPMTDSARRSIGGWKQSLTDVNGHYQFGGLPPGDYRVLATFDISQVEEEILDLAHVPVSRLDAGQRLTSDLPLWIAP
jgi:hypothetical protein